MADDMYVDGGGAADNEPHEVGADDEDEMMPEDAWIVIGQFFELNGMGRQQLHSFNNFMHLTIESL
eukprot:SAG22_NODE_18116_length_293_cov_0.711340_1_plen_65_part_01